MTAHTTLPDVPHRLAVFPSPLGRIELVGDGEHVTSISFEQDGSLPHDAFPLDSGAVLDDAAAQLDEYFSGERTKFSVPLLPRGTAFQLAVWDALGLVPFGAVVSYGELGYTAVGARGGRAIGRAVAANPIPLLIPSHRVVTREGRVRGFLGSSGIALKEWLLDHEGASYRPTAARR